MPPRPRPKPSLRGRASASSLVTTHDTPSDQPSSSTAAPPPIDDHAAPKGPESGINEVPIGPPQGRLDGLNRSLSRHGSSEPAGSPTAKPKLKFAPKSTQRKTKQEREELNALYAPMKQDGNLTEFGITRGGSSTRGYRGRDRGSRGGRGRGRGDFKRFEEAPSTASGPFAMGSVVTGKTKISMERTNGSSFRQSLGGPSKSKNKVKREGDGLDGVKSGGHYDSSDSDGAPKVDVEYIHVISDDEDELPNEGEKKVQLHDRSGFPIRIQRREHIERSGLPNVPPEGKDKKRLDELGSKAAGSAKGKGKEKDVQFVQEERKWKGVYDNDGQVQVKDEPMDEDGIPQSPGRSRRKTQSPEDKRRKPRRHSSSKNQKPLITTQEDLEEFDRLADDQLYMLTELGPALPKDDAPLELQADHLMQNANQEPIKQDSKKDKLFLFQFPPIIPVLKSDEDFKVGHQPKTEDAKDPLLPSERTTSPTTERKVKKKTESPERKAKPDPISTAKAFETLKEVMETPIPPGTAGKIRVHKSGKVTMLWGGIEFEVNRGTECEFLQDIVVMQKDTGIPDENGKVRARAWGMGQVKGKFVVSPNIGKLLAK